MNNTATQTGDTPIIYDLSKARFTPQDRERLLRISLQVLTGEVDTMIVRKNFKGGGLYIKGLNYTKD